MYGTNRRSSDLTLLGARCVIKVAVDKKEEPFSNY